MKTIRTVVPSPKSEVHRLQKLKKSKESTDERLERLEAKQDYIISLMERMVNRSGATIT